MMTLDLTDEEEWAPVRMPQERLDNLQFPFAPRPGATAIGAPARAKPQFQGPIRATGAA
jgi:hypothetical protein